MLCIFLAMSQGLDDSSLKADTLTITMEIVAPWDGQIVRAHTQAGQIVEIENLNTGEIYGFTVELTENDVYYVRYSELHTGLVDTEYAQTMSDDVFTLGDNNFLVSVLGHAVGEAPDEARPGKCCVTCGSTKSCGCAAEMSCGSCCVEYCCPEES